MLEVGQIVNHTYQIQKLIGIGGMGYVYQAEDLIAKRRVALKLLRSKFVSMDHSVERFQREALALTDLTHPNIVRVTDVGTLEDDLPYMVMELLLGRDLRAELKERGPLPIVEAVGIVMQACSAVEHAHAAGIVHRDLKPQNLFLTTEAGFGIVKLFDFGISKHTSDSDADLTSTVEMLGTPRYMSPEQIRSSKDIDGRSDLWSIGVIAYELLTAKSPFNAESPSAYIAAIVNDDPEPLRALRPDVPEGLEQLIFRAMNREPANRFQTAGALREALEEFGPPDGRFNVTAAGPLSLPALSLPSQDRETLRPGERIPRPLAAAETGRDEGRKQAIIYAPPTPMPTNLAGKDNESSLTSVTSTVSGVHSRTRTLLIAALAAVAAFGGSWLLKPTPQAEPASALAQPLPSGCTRASTHARHTRRY